MLAEIRCDKFMSNGVVRPPIRFNPGLNTILGSVSGSNSIGKSTFLMVIDFVFGGEDYVKKSKDVQQNVPVHLIQFMFKFEGEKYYFSRSTGDYTEVNVCDELYSIVDTVSVEKYTSMLAKLYNLDMEGISLRNAVGRFFRVYKRETLDEEKPLKSAKKESDKNAIEGLLKLFDRYTTVAEQSKIAEAAKDEESTLKKAQKYNQVIHAANKTAFKSNQKRIEELELEAQELAQKSSQGLLDLDSFQAEFLSELKNQLSNFRRHKSKLISQLRGTEMDRDFTKKSFEKNYEDLIEFFPEINIERLESIEQFHRELSIVLKKEFKENAESIQAMIDLASEEITKLEQQIVKIGKVENVSKLILDRYAAIENEIKILQEANENFEKVAELHSKTKEMEERLNGLVLEQIAVLQQQINEKMSELNHYIYNGRKTSPVLSITSASSYTFFTPNDSGTGSQYKGLIVFDLTVLEMTKLPVLAHDSILLKQIEDAAVEKILELYLKSSKQIFITLDKDASYTDKAREILNQTEILHLAPGSESLFGRSWNEIEQ